MKARCYLLILIAGFITVVPGVAQAKHAAGAHRGAINVLLSDEAGRILSAGQDGFLGIWDPKAGSAVERFQLSSYPVKAMCLKPGARDIAVCESDGLDLHRISVWDYENKTKRFTVRVRDPVSYLSYSGSGRFLIALRGSMAGPLFLDSVTGEPLEGMNYSGNAINFAATGKSERTMVCYSPLGILTYWNLEKGEEVLRLNVPMDIARAVLFSRSRFLAGFDSGGLVVVDAVGGKTLSRSREVKKGHIVTLGEGTEFIAVDTDSRRIFRLNIDNAGKVGIVKNEPFPEGVRTVSAAVSGAGTLFVGAQDGQVRAVQDGAAKSLAFQRQYEIADAAASQDTLALLSAQGSVAFIPADYRALSGEALGFDAAGAYDRVSGLPGQEEAPGFLLWNSDNSRRIAPQLRSASEKGLSLSSMAQLAASYRTVSVWQDKALFLEDSGNLTVVSLKNGKVLFNYYYMGALDAAFINDNTVLLGRSTGSGGSPFILVNINNGETSPFAHASAAGAIVHRGGSGEIYGAVLDQDGTDKKTSVIVLDLQDPAASRPVVEYEGEDTDFLLEECANSLAFTAGRDGALLYNEEQGLLPFERSSGLPVKLINGKDNFIVVDTEGSVVWHDPKNGSILAVLKVYNDGWVLERKKEGALSGAVTGIQ
jgi:WD40 repeat protein